MTRHPFPSYFTSHPQINVNGILSIDEKVKKIFHCIIPRNDINVVINLTTVAHLWRMINLEWFVKRAIRTSIHGLLTNYTFVVLLSGAYLKIQATQKHHVMHCAHSYLTQIAV